MHFKSPSSQKKLKYNLKGPDICGSPVVKAPCFQSRVNQFNPWLGD